MTSLCYMTLFNRSSCQDVGYFICYNFLEDFSHFLWVLNLKAWVVRLMFIICRLCSNGLHTLHLPDECRIFFFFFLEGRFSIFCGGVVVVNNFIAL